NWGLVEQVEPRRVGRRGPAAKAWVPIGDHWEWFRRVAAVRKERETDPVLPLLDECQRRARQSGANDLRQRLESLVGFVHLFDRGIGTVVRTDAGDLGRLFALLGRLDDRTLDRLLATLASLPEEEALAATRALARLPQGTVRRMVQLAARAGRLRFG
ncbi:MAG: hypothetical protein M3253_06680, partial [Chloroflexota bacterium]|nr:hypothetical protein [Chloroflexota bacterium]